MKIANWQWKPFPVSASFLLAIAVSGLGAQTARAQFTSPPGQGVPKSTAGGGSRPTSPFCLQTSNSQETLVAVAPTRFVGLTSNANPTVWIYVPNTTAKTLEFSLFTQNQEGVYQTNLPVSRAGLFKVTLPSNIALTPGKPYYWTAALVCNPKRRTEDWVVASWIQQQPLNHELQRKLAGASLEKQVQLYAQSGFWYEAFNTYLKLQQTQPRNAKLSAMGTDLLKSAELTPQQELLRIAEPASINQMQH